MRGAYGSSIRLGGREGGDDLAATAASLLALPTGLMMFTFYQL